MQYYSKMEPWVLRLLVVLLPAIITFCLIYYFFRTNIFSFIPTWSDEIEYWHEIKSFAEVGFQSGFYSVGELPAKASLTHFGPHGPMFTAVIGALASILGWHPYSGAILNITCITCTLIVYLYLTCLDYKQLITTGLVLITFWPMHIFMPTNMQESIHYSLAIVFSGIFYKLIKNNASVSPVFIHISLIFTIFSALIRPTWSFLLIPFFLFQLKIISPRNILVALLKSLLLILTIYRITSWYSAPYPNFISDFLTAFNDSILGGLLLLLKHSVINLKLIILGTNLEKVQRAQVLIAIIISCLTLLFGSNSRDGRILESTKLAYFNILNLGLIFLFIILFYDMFLWRDYRLIAPNLLLSILLAVTLSKNFLPYVIIATNFALAGPNFGTNYKDLLHDSFIHHRRSNIFKSISYKKSQNQWENTLLVDRENFNSDLIDLPAGIGISFFFSTNTIKLPIKSRYILVSVNNFKILNKKASLQQIGKKSNAILCLNHHSRMNGSINEQKGNFFAH